MIVCFGEPLVDVFASPVGATFEDAPAFLPRPGGAPLNVALALARSGVPARFVGTVGEDALGDRLLRDLRQAGVDPSAVARSARKTGMVLIQVGLDGSRRFLGYAESGAEYDFSPEHWDRASPEPLAGADWLVVGSGSLTREPMSAALHHVVARAKALRVPIAADLNVRAHLWASPEEMNREVGWLCRQVDLLRASEEDLDALGRPATAESLDELAPQAVGVLTLGARGALAVVHAARVHASAPAVPVVDTTGAGDAATAGLLAHLWTCHMHPRAHPNRFADSARWTRALECACRFGSHACTELGCTEAFAQRPLRCEHQETP